MDYLLASAIVGFIGFVVTQAVWLHSSNGENKNLRDRLDDAEKQIALVTGERDGLQVKADTARKQYETERDLRAVAESQRNEAFKQGVDHVVEQIKAANIADAGRLVVDILSRPLPGYNAAASGDGGSTKPAVHPAGDPGPAESGDWLP